MNVAALVVTYNRIDLLKKCIVALKNQTYKLDEILVVNNDSKDGTTEWLAEQSDLLVINQPNSGGAGGFNSGLKYFMDKDFEWIWCMDDDCLPTRNALNELMSISEGFLIRNSAVVEEDTYKLSFGLYDPIRSKFYEEYSQIESIKIINAVNFFNGSLISLNIIKQIGLPNPHFYIKGDEYEYFLRMRASNFYPVTISRSIVYHPRESKLIFNLGKYNFEYTHVPPWKKYYYYRNLVWINGLYKNELPLKRIIKNIIIDFFFSLVLGRFRSILYTYNGLKDGIMKKVPI